MQHLISRLNIESSQAFQRLLDKTQVLSQKLGMENVIRNRLTHSYEVATAAKIIATSISTKDFNADYQKSVFNVCLMHDIGHPPFGHEGGMLLNKKFKELGLTEGFSDNNNNLIVLERNNIEISNYELASLIKYPEKLYSSQQTYVQTLQDAIQQDIEFFKNFINIDKIPTRTLACEIMDEADKNTYTCSDLLDCYSMELDDSTALKELLQNKKFKNKQILEILKQAIKAIDSHDKISLKKAFNDIRILINTNYILGDNLKLIHKNSEIDLLAEELQKISNTRYIHGEYSKRKNSEGVQTLAVFIDYVLNHNFIFSKFYENKTNSTNNELEKLAFIRDMIADTTDNFVRKICEELEK